MFFQKVLKGINGLTLADAEVMVWSEGIHCNWWRVKKDITNPEIMVELTEANLIHHLNDYDTPLPSGHRWELHGSTYGDVSAFISTTAGAVQRDAFRKTNIIYDPFITALDFATKGFTATGYLFYAYLMVIGKKSVPLREFSEEVRELHIYTKWLPYHHEGEIAAKISIPSVNIEKAECYDGPQALLDFSRNTMPTPTATIPNPSYERPEQFTNLRELL